ncbi:transposase [Bacteroidia bacterium]|nr:transposase [Bacteroidia bacterium]
MEAKTVRRKFTADFKAKVAIAALQERSSVSELSKQYNLHPSVINAWKKELQQQSGKIFSEPHPKKDASEELINELYKQIGQLKVDNDWLKKKLL